MNFMLCLKHGSIITFILLKTAEVAEVAEVAESTTVPATFEDEDEGSAANADADANVVAEQETVITLVQGASPAVSVVLIGSFLAATAGSMSIMM